MESMLTLLMFFLLLSHYAFSPVSSDQQHPLDPLTPSEFSLVRTIVKKSYPSPNRNLTFQYISLDEPDKPTIISWLSNPGSTSPPRRALVTIRLEKESQYIIVDLTANSIISDNVYLGHGYPLLTLDEQDAASALPETYEPFIKSIEKRQLNLSDVICTTYTAGRRGGKYIVPVPKAEGTDYRASTQQPPFGPHPNGATFGQPDGPGFKIDGHNIRHIGGCYTEDLCPSYLRLTWTQLRIGTTKPSSIVVNLASANLQYHSSPSPIALSINAVFWDAYYAGEDGVPVNISNALCSFERYAGNIMWRHTESEISDEVIREVRAEVSLVVRMVAVVGNHDYIIDWEFKPDGTIKLGVGLTGVLEVKGVTYTHTDDIREDVYGTLLANNTIGIYHDHFLTYYLDLDVDGEANSFVKNNLETIRTTIQSSPRKSYWTVVSETAKTEGEARIQLGLNQPELIVVNPNKKTKLKLGIMSDTIRGAFTNNNVWVTPYNKSEKWAGGAFVDQSRGEDTLAVWSLIRNREIENKDIVLWYTIGFHHVPSQDEFPVMPTLSGGFELRPNNFFESNPVLKTRAPTLVPGPNCTTQG
ncbi:hypothetical protein FH972_015631 [Carpinus fangiana]|uniref:Amine oxidase n=1 Tax=Carpinus fangiana TaxID=176857 RepID=A0A5N6RDM9_9ROSI|nr:hypothetical protein FH972_015631 [Carpinus fangiana]